MAGISMNATAFYPSDIKETVTKIGKSLPAASGKRRWAQRVDSGGTPIHKRTWDISWEMVGETVRAQVETIALLATTFAFVDQHSVSYTVQCEDDPYQANVSDIGGDGTLYYSVSLKIYQQ